MSLGDRPQDAAANAGFGAPRQPVGTSPGQSTTTTSAEDRAALAASSPASGSAAASPASGSAAAATAEHTPAANDRALILHPSRRYPELWPEPAAQRAPSEHGSPPPSPTEHAPAASDRALILHPSRLHPELWPEPAAQRASSEHGSPPPPPTEHPAGNHRTLTIDPSWLPPSRLPPELWHGPAGQRQPRELGAPPPSSTERAPAADDRALILHPSRRSPERWREPPQPHPPVDEATVVPKHVGIELPEAAAEHTDAAVELPDAAAEHTDAAVELPDAAAEHTDAAAEHTDAAAEHTDAAVELPDAAAEHTDAAAGHEAHDTDRPPSAANVPLPESRPESVAGGDAEPTRSRRRADYYKAWSYMGQGVGAAMAIAGWGVLIGLPMEARVALLIAQLGLTVASASKNAFGSADDRHKGHQVTGTSERDVAKREGSRRKARGQAISAGAGTLAVVANAVPTAFPAPDRRLRVLNGVAALLNAYGQIETGRGELELGNPAKATGNFVASAVNVVGASGQFTEAGGGSKAAFPHAQGAGTLNSAMSPPGGAIDDAKASKRRWPYATDPKVVGQVLAFIGQELSADALWMFNAHRVSASLRTDPGQAQFDEAYLKTIAIIGLLGASILALGSGVSSYAEWPKQKAPGNDLELAVRGGEDRDTQPGDPPPAGQPAPT